ncbi:hypothetical protein D9758_016266 [Tetrapyrgos nigripes]|uniref:DUF6533 domain-containing protein n=1 Tax=Tetrapyrgos nigripes TaxID=182062 RepID=A0A8H5FHA9_9AGAR|nr:hypothetical protein D9758_016266 [Tetrapyrgos nigripes]
MDQGSNLGVGIFGIERQIMVHRYMYLLGITILYWDHIITFGDEVSYIWTRPKILSSYCFLIIRYLALVGTIPVTVVKFSVMSTSVQAIPFLLDCLDYFENCGYIRLYLLAYIRALRTESSNFGYYGRHKFVNYWDCFVFELRSRCRTDGIAF